MNTTEPSLADLAAATGLEPRTIRSWVAQGLLSAPLTRGPAARYPPDMLERVRAVIHMRDDLGMPLAEIRKDLLVATPDQIRAYADRARRPANQASPGPPPDGSSALDYIGALRARVGAAPPPPAPRSARGFDALEQRLGEGRPEPARKARAETWVRVPITPDIEFNVRAPLEAEHRVRLERCADLIRDILLGRDK